MKQGQGHVLVTANDSGQIHRLKLTHGYIMRGDKTETVVDRWKQDLNVDARHQTRSVINDVEPLHQTFTCLHRRRRRTAFAYVRRRRQRYFFVFRPNETNNRMY